MTSSLHKIPTGWQTTVADEYCIKVSDGTHATPKPTHHGKKLVTSKHLRDGRVDLSSTYSISNNDFDEINKRSKVDQWDVLVSMIGTVGEVALIDKTPDFAIKNVGLFKCGNKTKAKWLYYFLRSKVGQDEIRSRTSGTTQGYISLGELRSFPVIVPTSEKEMEEVVAVLTSLDNKIELLREQNKTLETLAKTIFKEWFVKFNFPGATGKMIDSELGPVPEGWKTGSLEDVTLTITDGSHFSPKTSDTGYPMASVKDMTDWGIDINSCRKISEEYYHELVRNNCRPLKNDILIAKDGSFLKHLFLVPKDLDLVVLSSIAIIRANENYAPTLLTCLLKSDLITKQLENIVSGAVISRIVLKDFRKFKIVIPANNIQLQAQDVINPIFEKCWNNNSQIEILSNIKDILLPKLMKGEIRVNI